MHSFNNVLNTYYVLSILLHPQSIELNKTVWQLQGIIFLLRKDNERLSVINQ